MVIIGGGPAGNSCATTAARLGAEVVLIERDTIGGAAHLWAMRMGLAEVGSEVDLQNLRQRVQAIETRLEHQVRSLLASQRVHLVNGTGTLVDAHTVRSVSETGSFNHHADVIVLATGSRPRIPDWAPIDGDRVMTTRDAYPPKSLPSHAIVIGSGVTGVEFVHLFESMGSEVTLVLAGEHR